VYPMFVCPGSKVRKEVGSMPGVFQQSVDQIVEECREVAALGIAAVILFGLPETKDATGASSLSATGVVQRAVEGIKKAKLNLLVITDVCLCEYTDHGHCGVIENGEVANDATLAILAEQALSHARAGADIVAPSDMMDGRVAAVRKKLDENSFADIAILSYAAKYSSAFYGPFREAAQSTPQFGDRRSYQMDPANVREALREVALDLEEGADMVMVKPALPYLDVIRAACAPSSVPVRAFRSVGGDALIMERGQGAYVYDADGNELIDFVCSWGAMLLGHAHPAVTAAITEQARKGTSFGVTTELELQLATLIRDAIPFLEKIRFVSSGTEATMSALRLARGVTRRDLLLKFEGCYHGHADSFLSQAGSGLATLGIAECPGVPDALAKLTLNAPYNDLAAVAKIFAAHGKNIAAVIVEPI